MASITQTIPSYTGGISEQPDQLKLPGQVKGIQNAIPDIVHGLYKRPGAKRIGTTPLANVQSGGSWFHYYRDETEGSYIGQVAADGKVRIWSCNDGTEKTVHYDTAGQTYNGSDSDHTSITSYLTPSVVDGVSQTEDIQALTINDTTFLNNRSKVVATTGTTTDRPHKNFAYIELARTENGRQYALNIYDDETTQNMSVCTKLETTSNTLGEGDSSGQCLGIGTAVTVRDDGSKKNLVFRISVLGQQGVVHGKTGTIDADDYGCSYSPEITLLHGGEGWPLNETFTTNGPSDKGALDSGSSPNTFNSQATFTLKVTDIEIAPIRANIKAVRPRPTPFDGDTSVSTDSILGGIASELAGVTVNGNALNYKLIGNGIYLYTTADADDFNVEIVDQDLMRVMQKEVNDVSTLPFQCVHGTIVKVSNTQRSDEDDYYVKFFGENDKDGPGSWKEVAAPGIVKSFDATTMPHILQRQADGTFLVKKYTYKDREVGDNVTNPIPSFVGKTINRVLFFRNRLAFLSGENVITSRPGSVAEPNFWSNTALTVSASDPIDISCSSNYPSDLYDAIETNTGLLCFSSNAQFLLASDDTIMNPDTAKLRAVSWYNYHKTIPPISLGQTIGWVDNSNKYSRFVEIANIAREGAPVIIDTSKIVPTLIPKDIDLFTNSRENNLIFIGKTGSDTVIGYRYIRTGDKQLQTAWFKWKFNNTLKYHFCINDEYYFLDVDNFLQKINLVQADADLSITQDSVDYQIHLDNYTTVSGGVYNSTTGITTFTNQSDWIDQVTAPDPIVNQLVVVDTDNETPRLGRYGVCTIINGDDFTVPGNWDYTEEFEFEHTSVNASNEQITLTTGSTDHGLETGDLVRFVEGTASVGGLTSGNNYYVIDASINNIALASSLSNANSGVAVNITSQGTGTHKVQKLITDLNIGYLYEYNVEFPRFYLQQTGEERVQSDTNSKLTVHRMKLSFGKIGLYSTTLSRVGKADYTDTYESTDMDEYDASDAPYLAEKIKDIPIYERNTNVNVTLKSSHPAPATLRSMSWEGDWAPMHYRRI